MSTVSTPNVAAAEASEVSAILPKSKVSQLERVPPRTKKNDKGSFYTENSKVCLGVADDRTVIWPYPNFDAVTMGVIQGFCKSQKLKEEDLFAGVCMDWVEANRVELEKHADKFVRVAQTTEDVAKKIAAAERQIKMLTELLAKKMELENAAAAELKKEDEAVDERSKMAKLADEALAKKATVTK